ncbi:MAG: FAD-binding oxidoreductase [Myxococcota bacterium]
MERRDFLRLGLGVAATGLAAACREPERRPTPDDAAVAAPDAAESPTPEVAEGVDVAAAEVAPAPVRCGPLHEREADAERQLERLRASLGAGDGTLLTPGDAGFEAAIAAFNGRTMRRPRAQLACKRVEAVAVAVQWAADQGVPFAIRGGGHSYEGFSQSEGLVVDQRPMASVAVDGDLVSVGTGASHGAMYAALAAHGLALPAGSCPPVGVSGHTLGGGYGFLARPLGLSCDNVVGLDLVDAAGCVVRADAGTNADLFWALRGAGNGSFGVVSRFDFRAHRLDRVTGFEVSWRRPVAEAVPIVRAWQAWAPDAPDDLTAVLSLNSNAQGIGVLVHGQSVGSVTATRAELERFVRSVGAAPGVPLQVWSKSFGDAMAAFGSAESRAPILMKGKSDYLRAAMSDAGLTTLLGGLAKRPGQIRVHLDSYGGAIGRVPAEATAFPHRAGARYSMQYGSTWRDPKHTAAYLAGLRELYQDMRPFVSGEAYVNYPDLDLTDGPEAYWGANLPRLRRVKAACDPANLFRHAQSVPVG